MTPLAPIPPGLTRDFRYCREIVHGHRENFPVGSWIIPRAIRPHIHAVYAFARTADDFADQPGRVAEERLQLLDQWDKRLRQSESGEGADHPIFRALTHTLRATGLPVGLLHDLLAAFRQDVVKKRYATLDELTEYCRLSANPVGRIVLHLLGEATPSHLDCSDAICTALQLTNHLQDLGRDVWAGRPLYLPTAMMESYGVTEAMILERRFSPASGALMLDLVELTREFLARGEPLLTGVAWPVNLELSVTWEAAMLLLEKIEESGGNTLRNRPTLERREWLACAWRAWQRVRA